MPSFKPRLEFHPKKLNLDTSSNFLGVPSGLDLSNKILPVKPVSVLLYPLYKGEKKGMRQGMRQGIVKTVRQTIEVRFGKVKTTLM